MSAQRRIEVVSGIVQTEAGVAAKLTVDGTGALKTAGGAGGGGDASAANQVLEIATLADILTAANTLTGVALDGNQFAANSEGQLGTLNAKLPSASVPANAETPGAVTKVQVILSAIEPNTSKIHKIDVDTSRRLAVLASTPNASTTSNSSSYQIQRTAAAFTCTVRAIEVFSTSAGFIVLVDKASAAADGDFPKGGSVWPIAAGGRVEKEWLRGKNFTAGCVIALCTSVSPTITLAVSADATFTVQLD